VRVARVTNCPERCPNSGEAERVNDFDLIDELRRHAATMSDDETIMALDSAADALEKYRRQRVSGYVQEFAESFNRCSVPGETARRNADQEMEWLMWMIARERTERRQS
jgi:hypothetical protein